MSLLDKASLIVTPNAYKASKLYSVIPNTTLGDMTVVRATTATRVNSSGLIESVAVNVPRLDYLNSACPSILVEPQRTNVQTYSADFSNAIYLKIGATITTNTNVSPDGNTTADKLVEDTSTGLHCIDILEPPVVAGSYTVSVFVKANGRTKFQILGFYALTGNVDFDLTLGTATTTAPALNGKIENYGNGWYRCSATFTDLTGTGAQILFNILNNAGSNSYTGDGTSGLILWGTQLEAGTYSTSYIPTVASSVTRNADVISKTGISSLIGQTEGTIFWEGYLFPSQVGQLVGVEKNGVDVIRLNKANTSQLILAEISINGNDIMYKTFNSVLGKNKIAFVYKSGNSKVFLNGVLVQSSSATFSVTSILDSISINSLWNSSSDITNTNINSIQLYKITLTDTECINLTTL